MNDIGAVRSAQREKPDGPPRGLLAILFVLVLLGVAGTTASILTARGTATATKQDVQQNQRLLQRVAELETINNRAATEHRIRNEELHGDICRLIYEVVQAAPSLRGKGIQPCSPTAMIMPTLPEPTETPR